ncbi:hypothetical protein SCLCIDRAFT_32021 [Scleroderma citrinum Foug A]|uniref:Casein kinase substrate phosphoprotein PP28 domain-containing protein n=1 Tax=Scleroderma citrinum Foug A TaxID=1036808 RepID=A0A0C2ZKS0_9AGAM|nr:hypothetical protein SCLCIDRAFT_32021 [Scleroderma citrinum Foug A]
MVRGTGKFKQKRGGGRQFSKNLELNEDGTAVSVDKSRHQQRDSESGSDDSDEEHEDQIEEEEEESGDEGDAGPTAGLSRDERRALKKHQAQEKFQKQQKEEEEDPDLINPNHVQKKLTISDIGSREPTRREREAKEKQEAKDRYWKLHVAGKTAEAKADLARLEKVREERAAAQAKRKAEAEAKAAEVEAKKAAAAGKRT